MYCAFIIVCVVVATVEVTSAPTDTIAERETLNYRLPTTIWPQHYVLEVTPYFRTEHGKEEFTFDGKVDITLSAIVREIREITLHSDGLNISSVIQLRDAIAPSTEIKVLSLIDDPRTHKYTLGLEKALPENRQYVLSLQYVGSLRNDMFGFYRSSYEEDGQIKWLATTQMQPTYARRVFPCFDEPQFKATFVVKINRPSHYRPSISNTKIESTDENAGPGLVQETFHRTPIMSTYLLAFIVSEFAIRENAPKTFNVYSRPKAFAQTEYSFNVGQQILAKLDGLFDYKYYSVPEITKMSMAALPDFDAGAMENWGLLTYREVALLYDPEESSSIAQQRIATVVAHEQVHMWFGDLVTCEWWKYTWLNEGFARYFQYFATALVYKEWDLDLQFVPDQLHTIFASDSLEFSYALTREVNTPDEIDSTFGSHSYMKGASIIRMTEHVLGHDKFITAIRQYLRKNALSTATPEKLFSALQKQASSLDIDIAALLTTYTTHAGYPVIDVEVQPNRRDIRITQRRFLLHDKDHNDNSKWTVPLSYATPFENSDFRNTKNQFLLRSTSPALEVNLLEKIDWIVFNVQQTGYYRVNYDKITWTNIGEALSTTPQKFHVLNRAQIVDDALNLARSGLMDYTMALQTIKFLQNETHYVPWLTAFNNFAYIANRLKSNEVVHYKEYMLRLLANAYEYLGFEGRKTDTRLDIYNRINILNIACRIGHKECISNAQKEFSKLTTTGYKVPANIRPVVYCTAVSESSDAKEWDYLWNAYQLTNVAAEQRVIMEALGCARNPESLKRYLNLILTNDVRLQDKQFAFYSTFRDAANTDIVFDFLRENHKKIAEAFQAKSMVGTILAALAARFTTEEQIQKLESFTENIRSEYGALQPLARAATTARSNLDWADRNMPDIIAFFKRGHSSNGLKLRVSSILITMVPVLHYPMFH